MKYQLQLYITGHSENSRRAVSNIKAILESRFRQQYDLEIIDIIDHPEAAIKAGIIATPTLIKKIPPPIRKVIGDLSDTDRVLYGLGLTLFKK